MNEEVMKLCNMHTAVKHKPVRFKNNFDRSERDKFYDHAMLHAAVGHLTKCNLTNLPAFPHPPFVIGVMYGTV